MTNYYFAKIGTGNNLARNYLAGDNEIKKPAIPIFFDCSFNNRNDFLERGNSREQGGNFFQCSDNPTDSLIVVIHAGNIHLMEPCGKVEFVISEVDEARIGANRDKHGYAKLLPVKIKNNIPIADIPAILAGISANRYYSSGTFRKIRDLGNICAIRSCLEEEILLPKNHTLSDVLRCLSSFEFETLIAKILEELGFFVPAYRGGNMQGADLFAHNLKSKQIKVSNHIVIEANCRISIQVKLATKMRTPPDGINYLVSIDAEPTNQCLGSEWICDALQTCSTTQKWLTQSLSWLPESVLQEHLGNSMAKIENFGENLSKD
jgi:hypothetical protein